MKIKFIKWHKDAVKPKRAYPTDIGLDLTAIKKHKTYSNGTILYDTGMPDGTPKKVLDISKIRKLGWEPSIGLKQGLEDTYKWFLRNEKYICKE